MKKVLIWGESAYLGEIAYFGKWEISHLRYSLYRIDSSIRIGLFVYNFSKNFSDIKMFLVFLKCKIGEKLSSLLHYKIFLKIIKK